MTDAPTAQTAAPAEPQRVPIEDVLPPGWELETQRIRRVQAPRPAPSKSGIKPTAPVMSATVGSMMAPILAAGCSAVGHPIPAEILIALPTVFAFVGGWFHADGRS